MVNKKKNDHCYFPFRRQFSNLYFIAVFKRTEFQALIYILCINIHKYIEEQNKNYKIWLEIIWNFKVLFLI